MPETLGRNWDLLLTLALAELRDRYGRGHWQLVKWLVDPFAVVGVYLILVAFILDRGGQDPGLSVACAVVPFQLVMTTIIHALQIIRSRTSQILNLGFRRDLLPLATTITEVLGFASSLVLIALMMIVYGVTPTVAMLWLPVAIANTILFAAACAYPAALFGLWFRDLIGFAVSAVRTTYFLAPGLIALSEIHGQTAELLKINPLTGLFESYRDALLYQHAPSAWEYLIPLAFSVVMLFVFVPIFAREEKHLAKVVYE